MYTQILFNYNGLLAILLEELERVKQQIIERMKSNGQFVTGKTTQAIRCEGETTESGVVVRIVAPLHIATLETGRKAGKVPYNFKNIIYQWTIDKKMPFESLSARKSFAYFTARKIAREGSWIHRQGFQVDLYTNLVNQYTEELKQKINFGDLYDITQVTKIIEK